MTKRTERERPIHLACLSYLRNHVPGALVNHPANEVDVPGKDVARAIAKRKHMGMTVGWPDLELLIDGVFHALEVKAEGNYLTPAQKDVKAALEAQGVRYAVVRSVDDLIETLDQWNIPHRGTIS